MSERCLPTLLPEEQEAMNETNDDDRLVVVSTGMRFRDAEDLLMIAGERGMSRLTLVRQILLGWLEEQRQQSEQES